jgi:L-ascorbate metabolism protein UlaG (beta-lactamase superfamily)
MHLHFYGHASLQLTIGSTKVVFDPFIANNPLASAAGITTNAIEADFILVTHAHYDHVADVIELAEKAGATVVSTPEVCGWVKKQGIEKCIDGNLGGTIHLPFGDVTIVRADHSSSFPDGSYGGVATGFIIEADGKRLYFSGDTALFSDMALFAAKGPIDLAMLCIGGHYTMGFEDAAMAASLVKAKAVLGMHYDTFPPIMLDREAASAAFSTVGAPLHLLAAGESLDI